MKTLNDLKVGQRSRVVKIHDLSENYQRLVDLGFTPGSVVRIIARAVLGGPLAVRLGSDTFALRVEEAQLIEIR
jgi:ferrous iron transport protein A